MVEFCVTVTVTAGKAVQWQCARRGVVDDVMVSGPIRPVKLLACSPAWIRTHAIRMQICITDHFATTACTLRSKKNCIYTTLAYSSQLSYTFAIYVPVRYVTITKETNKNLSCANLNFHARPHEIPSINRSYAYP